MNITLYDFWRSSAAYRVRIALHLKGLVFDRVAVDLTASAQKAADYKARNPQGLVPMLEVDGVAVTQSMAIIEYLDAVAPEPALIPKDPVKRARVMAMAQGIACDIHPINNLRVLKYLKNELDQEQPAIDEWIRHWIREGFAALETMADADSPFLSGDAPGIADICLIPQMYNARRFDTPLDDFPALLRIDAECTALPAFAAAHPDRVKPD